MTDPHEFPLCTTFQLFSSLLISLTGVHKIGGYTRTGLIALLGGIITSKAISQHTVSERSVSLRQSRFGILESRRNQRDRVLCPSQQDPRSKLLIEIYPPQDLGTLPRARDHVPQGPEAHHQE